MMAGPDRVWRERDGDQVAGHEVRVFEVDARGRTETFWLHPDLPFVLRWSIEADAFSTEAEVVEVSFNQPMPASAFQFEPPVGATEVTPPPPHDAASPCGPSGGRRVILPEGFLRPGYLPEGYVLAGCGTMGHTGAGVSAHMRGPDDGSLDVEQWRAEDVRGAGLPELFLTGDPVAIAGADGYVQAEERGTRLAWQTDELLIVLRADLLPLDELVRIAESMR